MTGPPGGPISGVHVEDGGTRFLQMVEVAVDPVGERTRNGTSDGVWHPEERVHRRVEAVRQIGVRVTRSLGMVDDPPILGVAVLTARLDHQSGDAFIAQPPEQALQGLDTSTL